MEVLRTKFVFNPIYFPTCIPNVIICNKRIDSLEHDLKEAKKEILHLKEKGNNQCEEINKIKDDLKVTRKEFEEFKINAFKSKAAIIDLNYTIEDGHYVFGGLRIPGSEICMGIRACNTVSLFNKCLKIVFTKDQLMIKKSENLEEFIRQREQMEFIAKFCIKVINNHILNSGDTKLHSLAVQQSDLNNQLKKLHDKFNRIKGDSRKRQKISDDRSDTISPDPNNHENSTSRSSNQDSENAGQLNVPFNNEIALFDNVFDTNEEEEDDGFDLSRLAD